MPLYEYYCRTCASKFEKLQPMRAATAPAACPEGHAGAERTISVFASFNRGDESGIDMMSAGDSGCCGGGGCACGGGMSRN